MLQFEFIIEFNNTDNIKIREFIGFASESTWPFQLVYRKQFELFVQEQPYAGSVHNSLCLFNDFQTFKFGFVIEQ